MTCPAPPSSLYGNRITALRWAAILRRLGHRVTIAGDWNGQPCDLLLALHAWRSSAAVLRFRQAHPAKPIVAALTGTDLYRDIHRYRRAQAALEAADHLVALQPLARRQLGRGLRGKLRVIHQSVERTRRAESPAPGAFVACVVGHLRRVKDPLRAAYAARSLPSRSRIRVLQFGGALEQRYARLALAEQSRNPRYEWRSEIPRPALRRLLAGSQLLVLSSRMEGGANVISEAVADGVPVLASRIPGSVGVLGDHYPGYFPVGDTRALRRLLLRAESDAAFYASLRRHCSRLAARFEPRREEAAWRRLMAEVVR